MENNKDFELSVSFDEYLKLKQGREVYIEKQLEHIVLVSGDRCEIVAASIGSHYGGPRKLMMTVRKNDSKPVS